MGECALLPWVGFVGAGDWTGGSLEKNPDVRCISLPYTPPLHPFLTVWWFREVHCAPLPSPPLPQTGGGSAPLHEVRSLCGVRPHPGFF